MEKENRITEYFANVETIKEHNGYFCSVQEALTTVILGSFCGLRNISQIHQWASSPRVREFLAEKFGIRVVPCYYWLICLMKLIVPESLNQCFTKWVESLLQEREQGYTVSFDGKTVRSTNKIKKYDKPLHIVSAHIAELGITFGQQAVYEKSNEIPAVRELIELLNLEGCMVVADALNCQKDTAKAIIESKADYLLNVKDNHPTLKQDIEEYVQDTQLQKAMDISTTLEKNRGRTEKRTAYTTSDIDWLCEKKEWIGLSSIGAIHRQVTTSDRTTDEWHYYISSRGLSAKELLNHARLEWSVESMHWLLDVHFNEDFCRVEDEYVQRNLNMTRKIALNCIKRFKDISKNKRPISNIMFDCLLTPEKIVDIISSIED